MNGGKLEKVRVVVDDTVKSWVYSSTTFDGIRFRSLF